MADTTDLAYVDRHALADDLTVAGSGTPADAGAPVAAVQLTNVAHRLGGRWALRGISLRVDRGEIVAIAGANGSGKTTLLRIVATTLAPGRGHGSVFGHDLTREPDSVRALTGMLGHATGLYDDLSPAQNLAFTLRMYDLRATDAVIDAALEAVGMRDHRSEVVRTLSSGMRRRVALARLWLRRPRLLLLDEPYNSFDASGVALVDALVRDTVLAGGAVLVVTHDLSRESAAGCDRVVTLEGGRVIAEAAGRVRK